jgi:hypothetical protein
MNDHRGPGGPNDHHDGPDCASMHPGGAAKHVDPPEATLGAVGAEMEASCKAGNCGISDETYSSLTSLGHTRAEVDCFLAEGQKNHNDGPPGDHHGGPGGMSGGPGGMPPMGANSGQ